MISSSIDKAFCKNLKALSKVKDDDDPKRAKLRTDYLKQRGRVHDVATGKAMEQIHFRVAKPYNTEISDSEPNETLKLINELKTVGFVETSSWFFCEQAIMLANIKPKEIILAAPSWSAIEVWRKKNGISTKSIEESVPEFDEACYTTAGADWLLIFGKGIRRQKMIELCLSTSKRPNWLEQGPDSLLKSIQKDKKGENIRQILEEDAFSNLHVKELAAVIRRNPIVFQQLTETLPKIFCAGDATSRKCEFIRDLFTGVSLKDESDRRQHSIALVRLGSGILTLDKKDNYSRYMECINALAGEVKEAVREEDQEETWILNKVGEEAEGLTGQHLSITGARQLASALLKIKESKNPEATIAAASRNLGMSNVGKAGEITTFNPTQHEDLDGGLIRSDQIQIVEPGWEFDKLVIIRAKVRKDS